jgi:hypothetical protein
MAGKKGRCKNCGQYMMVPRAEHLASMTSMPALAGVGAGAGGAAVAVPRSPLTGRAGPGVRGGAGPVSIGEWLKAGVSQIGLAPLSLQNIPKRQFAPSALDDAEDSKPYVLEKPDPRDARGHKGGGPPNVVMAAWRKETGKIQKIFRWLNQSAYLVSIPFVIILMFGIAVKAYSIALFGATFVVLLNLGRIVAGVANLAVIPLRDGLNFKKFKKPLRRVIEPIAWIAGVVIAFTFIPWLSTGKGSTGTISDRLRTTAEDLGKHIEGEVDTVAAKAKDLDLDKLGAQAQEKLKGVVDKAKTIDLNKLGSQAQDKLKGLRGSPGEPQSQPSPEGSTQPQASQVGELLKDVERGREVLKDLQKQP